MILNKLDKNHSVERRIKARLNINDHIKESQYLWGFKLLENVREDVKRILHNKFAGLLKQSRENLDIIQGELTLLSLIVEIDFIVDEFDKHVFIL